MKLNSRIAAATLAVSAYLATCAAQSSTPYTDEETGVQLSLWDFPGSGSNPAASGSFSFGLALPEDALTKDATEYIGLLRCSAGWCGISHGESGQMTQALLLMAWVSGDSVMTDFRFTSGYTMPGPYGGDATLTVIRSAVTDTGFEVLYRCQGCFAWDADGSPGGVATTGGFLVIGRALAATPPENAACPDTMTYQFHDLGFGQWGAQLEGIPNPSYTDWAALATQTPTDSCGPTTTTTEPPGGPTTTPTTTAAPYECTAAPEKTWDYVVVGAGAGGIPVADKLSEQGHSVLLLEKGPPSSGHWGGTLKPGWLNGTDLTRFDVPGLCNQIWHDSTGVACLDTDQMAGCVLGGGTAVNAGLWWKPHPLDWDTNFPESWHSGDVSSATERVFKRIPGTAVPSQDGKLYLQEGFEVLSSGLRKGGWKDLGLTPNASPDQKNHTFSHTVFMFAGGERGGPMASYLASAAARDNFGLWTNTAVGRIAREGGHATAVELECNGNGGYSGTVKLTPGKGRVIVAAGTFGSAKLLLRSGIGPADQLSIVQKSTDGPTMVPTEDWINLPVGYNLVDHVNTDTEIVHPDVVFYDFYEAWDNPIPTDEEKYLKERSGILATAAPNIGPMFWDQISIADGSTRQLQWTARVEGTTNYSMIMSQYLGRGSVSRGRMTITPQLNTRVQTAPYLHDEGDRAAVVQGIKNLQAALKTVPNITWVVPAANQTVEDYVDSLPLSASARRANHWMGTNKMGTDDGRVNNGSAVVDLDTKVYGTDNIFVVDASIFPGEATGNPSAMIVIAAEKASERILKVPFPE